ncbi:MAG: dienelactone hydrolase family protein [Armatimonadota bacterium]
MTRLKITILSIALILITNCAISAELQGRDIKFGPQKQYSGYFINPSGNAPRPALVVIHEWWGLNQQIKSQSMKLAQAGYAVLAVDLFNKSTTNPEEARQMVQGVNQQAATAELLAAAKYLRALRCVPDNRVGVLGWCFGGRQALMLAINDPKLAATVIYYGNPITDKARLKKIKSPILGIFGEADTSIPMQQVRDFRSALTEVGVKNEFHTYPGAGHAFANPSGGERYKPDAAADAWKKTMAFLNRYLKPGTIK